MRRSALAALLALLALLVVAGAAAYVFFTRPTRAALPGSGSLRGANVLLITIDTLRADRLGSYGGRVPTPALDALAARGVRFVHAYAHAPMTLPSHASILTGLTPPHHGVRNNGAFGLAASHQTIATIMRAAGYRTGAFVGAFVLDARYGLTRGFDVYDDYYVEESGPLDFGFVQRRAPEVLGPAASFILARADKYFAWVHLFDPHTPYDAPARHADNPYDNEVAYTDAQLGSFLHRLRSSGSLDNTLIVVTADHGEALGDHGEETHGLFGYDSTLRVPLIIAGPGIAAAASDAWISHADLLPTILDLIGIPVPAGLQGGSRAGHTSDRGGEIYFEALDANLTRNWAPLTGVIVDGWKFVDLPIPELYDLGADPGETQNRMASDPNRARQLAATRLAMSSATAPPASATADPDATARLRALGYTSSALPASARKTRYDEGDDPKRLVELNRTYTRGLELAGAGRYQEAVELLDGLVAARQDFAAAYTAVAAVLIQSGRPLDAVDRLEAARRAGVESPEVVERLGAAHLAAGRIDRVIAVLEPLMKQAPSADARNTLAVAYAQAGRAEDARRLFQDVLASDPSAAGTWNNLGLLELRAGRSDAAAEAFRRAVQVDPRYGPAWEGLGAALLHRDRDQAIAAWTRAVELMPDAFDTLFNVGMLLAESKEPSRALPYLRRFADTAPRDRYAADIARVRKVIAKIRP